MPLMACPQCGKNVSSLASMCPKCSYSLREQRLKEGQLGPQVTCRKCGQKISAKANVCPHCGVDFPKRTFNLLVAAVPIGAVILVFAIGKLVPDRSGPTDLATAPPPLTTEPPEIAPPQADVVLGDSVDTPAIDAVVRASPIVVATPLTVPEQVETTARSTTRWTATWVNVRRDPSGRAPVEQQLNPGVRLEVGRFESGFWEVFLDGRRLGYVANSLLLSEPPEP
jgi:RNA polymerase subunit RPABC4/transcription elongation factor Spt4